MPFKWYLNRYRCFYCDETFIDCSKLKEHTKKHDEIKLNRILKRIGCYSRLKWDISEISCKLCPKSIQNFDHYLKHLSDAHDLEIDRDVFDKYCYIFNLSDDGMVCIECCESFNFFGPLLRHVNKFHNNAQKYVCDYCGLAFTLKGTIKHHIRNVHTDLKTTCTLCGKNFKSKVRLANHSRKAHKTGKFACDMCPETFESRYLRTCHIAIGHNVKSLQFPCEKCTKIFTRKSALSKHVSVVHLKEKFTTCHLCGHKGYDMQALRRHMNSHDPAKHFECQLCGLRFRMKKTFFAHMTKHHKKTQEVYILDYVEEEARLAEKQRKDDLTRFITIILENSSILPFRWAANKYMCFYCCCSFVDSAKLKEHTIEEHKGANLKNVLRTLVGSSRVKLDTSEIICNKCKNQFHVFDEFVNHLASFHEFKFNKEIANCIFTFHLSDDVISCQECGQEFRFFGTLLKHAHKFHNKYKTFLCEICGQGFVAYANVVSHIKNVHTFSQGLKCRRCDKVFRNSYSLQIHCERVHRTEMLKCPKCPEILASQYFKKRHLALVHDVKKLQFKCDQCELLFTMKSRLVQHKLRTHLKQKTVACEVCGFKVFNNELLKRHMVRHDDSRPFECKICEKAFQRKKTLDIHMRIHTNDKRYVCKECERAFVQVTSLKLHMRLHHGGAGGTRGAEGASWH